MLELQLSGLLEGKEGLIGESVTVEDREEQETDYATLAKILVAAQGCPALASVHANGVGYATLLVMGREKRWYLIESESPTSETKRIKFQGDL